VSSTHAGYGKLQVLNEADMKDVRCVLALHNDYFTAEPFIRHEYEFRIQKIGIFLFLFYACVSYAAICCAWNRRKRRRFTGMNIPSLTPCTLKRNSLSLCLSVTVGDHYRAFRRNSSTHWKNNWGNLTVHFSAVFALCV
jgi:hypothetical protein